MIDKQTEELASLYVLDLLDGETLLYFESRIEQDPELAQFIYSLYETTSALTLSSYPERQSGAAPSFDAIRKQIRFVPQTQPPVASVSAFPPSKKANRSWLRFWPIAATILLTANLSLLLFKDISPEKGHPLTTDLPHESTTQISIKTNIETLNEQLNQLENQNKQLAAENQALAAQLEQSKQPANYTIKAVPPNAKETAATSETKPDNLREHMMTYLRNHPNVGRLTIMELSPASQDSPQAVNQPTIMDTMSDTIENIVILLSSNEAFWNNGRYTFNNNGGPFNPTTNADTFSPHSGGNNINLESWAGYTVYSDPTVSIEEESPQVAEANNASPTNNSNAPQGKNIWDERGKGYLELENLPVLSANEAYYVWVKDIEDVDSDAKNFLNVGRIPPSNSQKLSLSYTVDQEDFIPGKIMITRESNPDPLFPSDNIVLQ